MNKKVDEDDEEFSSNPMDCIDDETTLEAELRLKPEISAEDEIALLNKEAEMSVEELRAIYAGAGVQSLGQVQPTKEDDADEDNDLTVAAAADLVNSCKRHADSESQVVGDNMLRI